MDLEIDRVRFLRSSFPPPEVNVPEVRNHGTVCKCKLTSVLYRQLKPLSPAKQNEGLSSFCNLCQDSDSTPKSCRYNSKSTTGGC